MTVHQLVPRAGDASTFVAAAKVPAAIRFESVGKVY